MWSLFIFIVWKKIEIMTEYLNVKSRAINTHINVLVVHEYPFAF